MLLVINSALDSSTAAFRSNPANFSPDEERRFRTQRLWQEYLRDPSQWWDNRLNKTNRSSPGFMHRLTQESLWIDRWYNPVWVTDMLDEKEAEQCGSQGMSIENGHPENEQHKVRYRSAMRVDALRRQQLENSPWEMLALEEALNILDRMSVLPSIDNLVCLLRKCRKDKNLANAKHLHAYICKNGLESHRVLGNYIVPMFVECGSMTDAQQVFNRLGYRNENSWTSLILGYVGCGQSQHALDLYQKMQEESIEPSSYTFMALLKACAKLKDAERGREMHTDIVQNGYKVNVFVGSTLVDMYAKCGFLAEAKEVFDNLPARNVVSWNALIAGYAEHGPGQKALECFEHMQLQGVPPDAITFVCVLKSCGKVGAIDKGREIHTSISPKVFKRYLSVGNSLIDMYAKCGSLGEAQDVFDKLSVRDVVSWTTLISGYVEYGPVQEALKCFQRMQLEGISPNAVTFVLVLKACGNIRFIEKGREIHANVIAEGFEREVAIGNALVYMYAKCSSLTEAQEAFDKLSVRDVVSWTALISGYAEHGLGQKALKCFKHMQLEGISPNAATFVCVLKACGNVGAIGKGREIHSDTKIKGFEGDVFIGSTLVNMYAKCGSLAEAQEVFDKMAVRDVVSWTAIIGGYAEHGPCQEALKCFEQMQLNGVSPDAVTFVCVLKACGNIGAIDKGRQVHTAITLTGFETEVLLGNALVDMYAKCGCLAEAHKVFENISVKDAVSWNALIAGYAEHGPGQGALTCFEQMQLEGISPDAITFVCLLKVCGNMGAIDKGREIHASIDQKGLEKDVFISSTLVDMYAKCGFLTEAQEVFGSLLVPDVVAWTALLAGYTDHGPGQEALKCFKHMQLEGISPNVVTFAFVLKACGNIGAIDKGREIHTQIATHGFEKDISVGNSLIDMYTKCGSLSEAREVFDKLPVQDVMSWSAMIKGYGMNHEGNMAVQCFEDMQMKGLKPDDITFTCLLTACSRSRLVLEGQIFFKVMREEYGITPTMDHYTCMVDLLAQSRHLYQAENLIETMPCPPSKETWTALLSACKTYGDAELGQRCFQQLILINPECAGPYVLMAKIYASVDRWDDAYRVEDLRKNIGAKKKPAIALIEVNKKVHEFTVGDHQTKEISAMLEALNLRVEEEGHVPSKKLLLRPIFYEEKEATSCEHAEKLAIAFGILNTPQGQTLRVTKNMRMCNDCHNTTKIISRIERREIIVRDVYCVHHFRGGLCSCSDMC